VSMLETPERVRESPTAVVRGRFARFRPATPIGEAKSPTALRQREALSRWTLAGADVAAAAVALGTVALAFGDGDLQLATLVLLPAVIIASKVIGLYDRDDLVLHKATLDEAPELFQLATLYALLLGVISGAFGAGVTGAGQVVTLWLTFFVALVLCRWAARATVRWLAQPERCLFIGDAQAADHVHASLQRGRRTKAEVVVAVPLGEDGLSGPGAKGDLRALVESHHVHRVIIAPASTDSEVVLDVVRTAKALGVRVSIVPRIFEVVGSSVRFDQIDGLTMLGVRRFGLTRSSELVKRCFDVVGATMLLVLFAPLLAVAAIAIRLDSPGSVFFRQTRVGRGGKPFQILKFRTMVADAEARKEELRALNETDGLFKIARDPRITRVGSLLRRSSLDELPQLVNVMRGEMSLVGPRPLVVDEDSLIQGWQRRRLHLTPGVTGHWQILGSGRIPLHEMVKIDHLYLANWSLWLDLKILMRTVAHVLGRQGM
jgi:exopolysaccharide biosynthesis polyprenyl glycosylphosphotransferase